MAGLIRPIRSVIALTTGKLAAYLSLVVVLTDEAAVLLEDDSRARSSSFRPTPKSALKPTTAALRDGNLLSRPMTGHRKGER